MSRITELLNLAGFDGMIVTVMRTSSGPEMFEIYKAIQVFSCIACARDEIGGLQLGTARQSNFEKYIQLEE